MNVSILALPQLHVDWIVLFIWMIMICELLLSLYMCMYVNVPDTELINEQRKIEYWYYELMLSGCYVGPKWYCALSRAPGSLTGFIDKFI